MPYEKSNEALLSDSGFLLRMLKSFAVTLIIVGFSLSFGMMGYCYFGNLPWDDGLLNAAMILTGMGPVDHMNSTPGKLFATFYALYSGIAFLSMMAVIMAPVLHRFMHRFHLEDDA